MKIRLAVLFGEVADLERRHPSEWVSGRLGSSRKEASGIRGARVPRRKVARDFLGRLNLGLSPVGPLGWAGWVGEPSPGPWYPHSFHFYILSSLISLKAL